MAVLDDEGRLFGVVNVVDALVVLLVVAVALAGAALVLNGSNSTGTELTDPRYVTLDATAQPDFIVQQIDVGDRSQAGRYNLTVTDVYLAPGGDGTRTVLRVAVTGPTTDGQVRLDGAPLRLGRTLQFGTPTYNVTGTVTDVGGEPTLETGHTRVVVRGVVASDVASGIQPGDAVSAGGRTTVLVEDVAVFEAENPNRRRVSLVANLSTYEAGGAARFGATRLQSGQPLSFPVGGQTFSGEIQRVGGGLDRATRNVVVTDVVNTGEAARIAPGDTYRVAGDPVATVENVSVYDTGDPNRKRVYAGLALETLGYTDQPIFGDAFLQTGATVPFRTSAYDLAGEVVRTGTADLARSTEDVLVTTTVDADVAQALSTGDTYRVAGDPVATVESLSVYGTNDPGQKRVFVGLSLQTVGHESVPMFGADRPVVEGTTVPFRTNAYDFRGDIVRVGALEQRGTETTATVTLRMEGVRPERADDIRGGMTEVGGGETVARLVDVRSQPATVVLTSDAGDIFAREHPVLRDLTVTAEFTVRETATGTLFKGRRLQVGGDVTLALGSTTVRATVVSVDT